MYKLRQVRKRNSLTVNNIMVRKYCFPSTEKFSRQNTKKKRKLTLVSTNVMM